jgi:hypothetical protein
MSLAADRAHRKPDLLVLETLLAGTASDFSWQAGTALDLGDEDVPGHDRSLAES